MLVSIGQVWEGLGTRLLHKSTVLFYRADSISIIQLKTKQLMQSCLNSLVVHSDAWQLATSLVANWLFGSYDGVMTCTITC